MKLNRNNILNNYKWLSKKNCSFIISSDYDGLICASFLHHYFNWQLTGYYDYNSIWLSDAAIKNKNNLIWVDLNILPIMGKSLGGHIVSIDKKIPNGFKTSCNPNILLNLTHENFSNKFPFSTLIFLLWIFNIQIKNNNMARLLALHSDNSWMKIQKYSKNINSWIKILEDYNWEFLFKNVNTLGFEKKVDQFLYPKLINIGATTKFSKLKSNYLNIQSRECKINPDWDSDIILKLFNLFSENLGWTSPNIPLITKKIMGTQFKSDLQKLKKIGVNNFIEKKKVFSYAITSPNKFSYTIFKKINS